MGNEEPSGQQAVDIEAALRWADRHEARERQKLRDMGLPPEGDMPVTGAFFVRGLVAMLRTAAPTAPSDTARLDFLDRCNARLNAKYGTNYHWKLILNHNVSRLMLGHLEVDLNDAEARGLPSCRDAIDAKMRECGTPVSAAAPSTAAGEMAFVCGCGWDGSYADLNETVEGMTCPKCRLGRNLDCAAALATPPAQVSDMRQDYAFQAPDSGSVSAPADVPWQEQAARQCEEWALLLSAKGSNAAKVFDRIQFNADAVKLRDHARAFRALLSKPAKGEG